ncbi:MAG: hypothetical protein HQM10_16185 [Candidatus Riflebacteria bacterium]|nr:hypothetical protein [Candidatus Riflebacteria bacterium]
MLFYITTNIKGRAFDWKVHLMMISVVFLFGITACLSQIALFRLFFCTFSGCELHLGIFLSVWLSFVALGSIIGTFKISSVQNFFLFSFCSPFLSLFAAFYFLHAFSFITGSLISVTQSILFLLLTVPPLALPAGAAVPVCVRNFRSNAALPYSFESLGSFFGGILFSFVFEGKASTIEILLSIPILITTAWAIVSRSKMKLLIIPVVVALAAFFQNQVHTNFELLIWKKMQPEMQLMKVCETPYGKIQLGEYSGQKSLFMNGHYFESWPDSSTAEDKIHFFMSAIASPSEILLIGAVNPDVLNELGKYRKTHFDIVEIDEILMKTMSENASSTEQISFICEDPRRFINTADHNNITGHNQSTLEQSGAGGTTNVKNSQAKDANYNGLKKYDGILIAGGDPVYLSDNRLFTHQAFTAASRILKKGGIFSASTAGCENYLGDEMQEVILTFYQTLKTSFPFVSAFPGNRIIFFASNESDCVPQNSESFIRNLSRRNIHAESFNAYSLNNRMLPFRMNELKKWLKSEKVYYPDSDTQPGSFLRQLQLWDICSSSNFSPVIRFFSRMSLQKTVLTVFIAYAIIFFIFSLFPAYTASGIPLFCSGVSGFTSLLAEMALIFMFQMHEGAMHKMTAFFFGTFMLGLSTGSLSGLKFLQKYPLKKPETILFQIKILQAIFYLLCFAFCFQSEYHNSFLIFSGIAAASFIAGFEFSVIEKAISHSCTITLKSGSLAAAILTAENIGGLSGALLAGIWLFPVLGTSGTFLLCIFLTAGASVLLKLRPTSR